MTQTEQKPARRPKYDQRLLASLSAGKSWRASAQEVGCSPRTVARRMADPLFRAELDDLKRNNARQGAASLAAELPGAVATLVALCADQNSWVRLKAAKTLSELAIEYNQEVLLVERLAALEERITERMAAR